MGIKEKGNDMCKPQRSTQSSCKKFILTVILSKIAKSNVKLSLQIKIFIET